MGQAPWIICPDCEGEGKTSKHFGAITSSEWHDDWDDESREAYIRGDYDRACDACSGRGSIRKDDHAAMVELENDPAWQSERWLREIGA